MITDITGTSLYYCSLAVKPAQRECYVAAQLACETIMDIAERYKEQSVAHGKLLWWEKEVDRLKEGKPSHPIAKVLLGVKDQQALCSTLSAIVDCALTAINLEGFESKISLYQHYQHSGGLLEALKAQILLQRPLTDEERKAAYQVGVGLEIIRHINLSAEHQYRGVNYAPCAYIELASDAKERLSFSNKLPRALRVGAAISLKLLKKIESDQFQIDRYQYTLSPLQKLITLWRTG